MLNIFGHLNANKLVKPKKETIYISYDNRTFGPGKNIYIQVEPEAIYSYRNFLIANKNKFYKILTYDEEVLSKCDNSIFYLGKTPWIPEKIYNSINIDDKKFAISSVTGSKRQTIGHKFRQQLYFNQNKITVPKLFFRSSRGAILPEVKNPYNPLLKNSKIELFSVFQFSLAIENSRQNNYFSEKLLDCLFTKTIPIYYGAPNISNYFDTTGWIILENENLKEAIEKINSLDKDYYQKYLPIIEKNFKTCIEKYNRDNDYIKAINDVFKTLPEFSD